MKRILERFLRWPRRLCCHGRLQSYSGTTGQAGGARPSMQCEENFNAMDKNKDGVVTGRSS